jgi:hypothetical protein
MARGIVIKTGVTEEGRIYSDIYRMGRLWRRLTSTGERPFETQAEAQKYAKMHVKRIPR